ncbi:MAG TPA: ATP-dependent DNA helicase RecG [Candidatus Acidoferrales bacterium]|nr:ATP-dependent DNA helicase RecG [Candidatus Acidoferrales bacterium]
MNADPSGRKEDPRADLYERSAARPQDCLSALRTPLRFLGGIGPKRALQLEKLGLNTVEDLLYHLPFRYEDRRLIGETRSAQPGREQTFAGRLVRLEKKYVPGRRGYLLVGILADATGALELVWYRPTPFIQRELRLGSALLVHGKVERGVRWHKIIHPEFERLDVGEQGARARILPVYWRTEGLPLGSLRRWIGQALGAYGRYLPSFIPDAIAARQQLMDLRRALAAVHLPDPSADLPALNRLSSAAHRSVIFDEFFYLQLGLGLKKRTRAAASGIAFKERRELTARMRALLPFELTRAQERVLSEIYSGMEAAYPMQRLIQGDVGSGKTILAWLATLRAIENGFQAVWLAPTEILAEQHFANLRTYAERLGVSSALLTGSLARAEKRRALERIALGETQFIVGTHAVIQEGVRVPRMGLGVIDEQHRFGVAQRAALRTLTHWAAGATPERPQPDILLMSATPIPRSLALVLYGDLEVSSLEESPPGRPPVQTWVIGESRRAEMYGKMAANLRHGRQAYVVCPLIETSERLELRDATRVAEELSTGPLREFRVGLIHGRMSAAERERTMRRFKAGRMQVLVATTVIEVGIDIPNATVMVVEHADRFGLSQLHQLRGRVGRGSERSMCILLCSAGAGPEGLARLRIMQKEHNGFRIAQADLALRGPGEFLGTRQSGLADFRLANLMRDSELLLKARKEAIDWLAFDPRLERPESKALKIVLQRRWGERLELGNIG